MFSIWCMEVLNIGVRMFKDVQVLVLWCMDVLCWDVLMYVRCLEVLGRY